MIQIIEISIYILIAMGMFSYRRVMSGRKNGCFYHKNDDPLPPFLVDEIKNIHNIESPSWRVQTIGVFLMVLAIQRIGNYSFDFWHIVIQLAITGVITLGTIQTPSYHFQRGITAGLKQDWELDSITKSEVVIPIINVRFWKPRLFNNRGRIVAQWLGVIEIITGTGALIWFNLIS
ncbi:MAG: hypothetical protein QM504_10940 [Pseudomonadota bacterium]